MLKSSLGLGVIALISVNGCAAAQPSQQLVDARDVMSHAKGGHAQEYAPDYLLEAKKLLEQAEQAKDGSEEEVQFAYRADRATRRAQAHGHTLFLSEQVEDADAKYNKLQEQGRVQAEESLAKTRLDLAEVEEKLKLKDADADELGKRKAELEASQTRIATELSSAQEKLVAAETARKEAQARAAAAIASLKEMASVKEEGNRMVVTLSGSVLFKTGQSALLPIAENSLTSVATALKELSSQQSVVIEGHTDSDGDDSSNQELSQARSNSVMMYLVSQGVDAKKMKAIGRGESQPIATNATPEGRANNRRVELIINR